MSRHILFKVKRNCINIHQQKKSFNIDLFGKYRFSCQLLLSQSGNFEYPRKGQHYVKVSGINLS